MASQRAAISSKRPQPTAVTRKVPSPRYRRIGYRIATADGGDSAKQTTNKKGSSSMGAIVLLVGVIGLGVVIAAVTAFALTRGRRNSANGVPNSWHYPQQTVYPPQQTMPPAAQPVYPTSAPNPPYGGLRS